MKYLSLGLAQEGKFCIKTLAKAAQSAYYMVRLTNYEIDCTCSHITGKSNAYSDFILLLSAMKHLQKVKFTKCTFIFTGEPKVGTLLNGAKWRKVEFEHPNFINTYGRQLKYNYVEEKMFDMKEKIKIAGKRKSFHLDLHVDDWPYELKSSLW